MSESQCSINPAVFGIAVFLLQSLFTLKFEEKKSNILISLISFKMSLSTFEHSHHHGIIFQEQFLGFWATCGNLVHHNLCLC